MVLLINVTMIVNTILQVDYYTDVALLISDIKSNGVLFFSFLSYII